MKESCARVRQSSADREFDAFYVGGSRLPKISLGTALITDTSDGFDIEIYLPNSEVMFDGHVGADQNFVYLLDYRTWEVRRHFQVEFEPLDTSSGSFRIILFEEVRKKSGALKGFKRTGEIHFFKKVENGMFYDTSPEPLSTSYAP